MDDLKIKKIIEECGCEYRGIQNFPPELVLFNEPYLNSTVALRKSFFSKKRLLNKLERMKKILDIK